MPEKGTLHAMIRWETVCGDFPPTWAGWGGGGGGWGGCEGFRGEVESLWHVFEWKYMMYWFPCVN